MSADSISRWNAIPLIRSSETASTKRPRSTSVDSSDDDFSLVSRSPSPQPMNVDSVHLYDEHRDVRGVAREVITVDTKIKSTNKGFAMLARMGWSDGQPLGLSPDGRVDPVPFSVKQDSTGLGKVSQDFRMIETTVSQRRELDSERMQKETEEQRRLREDAVAQKAAVKDEISTVLRPFYCQLCDKQFQNVAQYDEHTNSYAHHHKARLRDMQSHHPLKQGGKEESERRKEKERKREEKELKKMAEAAGIKISVPSSSPAIRAGDIGLSSSQKPSGWAPLNNAASDEPYNAAETSRVGWSAFTNGGPASTNTVTPARPTASHSSGGWGSVDRANRLPRPPPVATAQVHPLHPQSTEPSRGGWTSIQPSDDPPRGSMPTLTDPPRPIASAQPTTPIVNERPVKPNPDQSQGNWQQFQKRRGRR